MPARRDTLAGLVERMSGAARGSTIAPRTASYGQPESLGRASYLIYNVDEDSLTKDRTIAIAESAVGRRLTEYERKHAHITRLEERDYRQETRPTDRLTGERLRIYRPMRAFKLTLS